MHQRYVQMRSGRVVMEARRTQTQDTEAGDGIYIQKVDVQKTKAGKGKPNKVVTDKGRVRVSLFDCNSHVILGDSKNQHLQSSRRICW